MKAPTVVNVVLLALFAGLVALNLGLAPDPSRKNVEFLPEMVDSVPYDSLAPNPVFADGKTLQPPPEGTIPRGRMPLHYTAGEQEAARAGRELHNPFVAPAGLEPPAVLDPADPDAAAVRPAFERTRDRAARHLARGERVYAIYCTLCHGPEGGGDGPVAKRGFPAPPSLLTEKARSMPDGRMFHLITHGGENMPSYAAQVDREDRWKAILHVRELQRRGPVVATPPAEPTGPPPGATRATDDTDHQTAEVSAP